RRRHRQPPRPPAGAHAGRARLSGARQRRPTVSRRRLRFGLKVAQMGGSYQEIRDAWLEADHLGCDTAWAHDHLLNQNDQSRHEDEGWTILTALLAQSRRIRGG